MSATLGPDWGDIETFLHTARSGTLAAAAQHLDVHASTVQRRIGRLEEVLNVTLFVRSQRGYSLTDAGQTLYDHAIDIEEEVLAIRRRIGASNEEVRGTIHVATVDDLANTVLTPILAEFQKAYPGITIELSIASSFADLERQQAHVALRFGKKPSSPSVIARRLTGVDVRLYGATKYLKKHGPIDKLDDLHEHFIVRGDKSMSGLAMEKIVEDHSNPEKVAVRSNSMLTRVSAIGQGLGVGFLPKFMGERTAGIKALDFRFPEAQASMWMVIHTDLRKNARVRALVDFVQEQITAQRPLFEDGGVGGI